MSKVNMREVMPDIARFIDQMRAAFGAESIDAQLRRAMRGEPTFFAYGRGNAIGAPNTAERVHVWRDAWNKEHVMVPLWVTYARDLARERGLSIAPAVPSDAADVEREAKQLLEVIGPVRPIVSIRTTKGE